MLCRNKAALKLDSTKQKKLQQAACYACRWNWLPDCLSESIWGHNFPVGADGVRCVVFSAKQMWARYMEVWLHDP